MIHLKQMLALGSALGLVGLLAGCSQEAGVASEESLGEATEALCSYECPVTPAALTPPAGETIKSKLLGVGVQIYMCTANASASAFTWTFVAPQANLFNDDGKLVGTHFIGPTWQGNDGSSVVGKKVAGVSVDSTAVPWLLLQGISHSGESGRFDDVTSIQRLSTVGGNAPADGCDATHVGAIAQVPYSTDYVFYRAKPKGSVQQCGG